MQLDPAAVLAHTPHSLSRLPDAMPLQAQAKHEAWVQAFVDALANNRQATTGPRVGQTALDQLYATYTEHVGIYGESGHSAPVDALLARRAHPVNLAYAALLDHVARGPTFRAANAVLPVLDAALADTPTPDVKAMVQAIARAEQASITADQATVIALAVRLRLAVDAAHPAAPALWAGLVPLHDLILITLAHEPLTPGLVAFIQGQPNPWAAALAHALVHPDAPVRVMTRLWQALPATAHAAVRAQLDIYRQDPDPARRATYRTTLAQQADAMRPVIPAPFWAQVPGLAAPAPTRSTAELLRQLRPAR